MSHFDELSPYTQRELAVMLRAALLSAGGTITIRDADIRAAQAQPPTIRRYNDRINGRIQFRIIDEGGLALAAAAHTAFRSGDVVARISDALPRYRYAFADERALHEGIAAVLADLEVTYHREHVAGPADRFDFLCAEGVVIEAKINGSMSEAMRQVFRYCARPDVSAVVLVTTRAWAKTAISDVASPEGKQIRVVHLGGQAF